MRPIERVEPRLLNPQDSLALDEEGQEIIPPQGGDYRVAVHVLRRNVRNTYGDEKARLASLACIRAWERDGHITPSGLRPEFAVALGGQRATLGQLWRLDIAWTLGPG